MPVQTTDAATLPHLAPAERSSLTEAVAVQLADTIVERDLGPGARLPAERDMAKQLQVSRIVVREALSRLAQRGLIEVRPGVGTFVASHSERAVTDSLQLYLRRHRIGHEQLFAVRHALEPTIAAAASANATAGQLAAMASNLERTFALVDAIDRNVDAIEAFAWADVEFHQLLATASGNPLFELLLAPLIDRLLDVRRIGARLPGTARRAALGHRAVLDAVRARDPEAAAAHMTDHLHAVQRWLPEPATTTTPRGRPTPSGRHEEEP
jgi:GntR family transcriptional regulator, transcriptional repressor for pyruvate dehydrogenase complex